MNLIDDPGHKVVDGRYRLSDGQARAILDLRLHRLTALGMDEIGNELEGLGEKIADYLEILSSRPRLIGILREELTEVREKYATPRRTTIEEFEFEHDEEDLIPREDMVVTVSHSGYVKRVPLSTYRVQRRGGKGRSGMATRDEDFVEGLCGQHPHAGAVLLLGRQGLQDEDLPHPAGAAEWTRSRRCRTCCRWIRTR